MTRKFIVLILLLLTAVVSYGQALRSIDGSNNNTAFPEWGSEGDLLLSLTPPSYADGIGAMSDYNRPNTRDISNKMFDQSDLISDEQFLSDFVWVFGQFIDHDVVLVDNNLSEPLFISIPDNDPVFSPDGAPIAMFRSQAADGTGTSQDNPRQYSNEISAFIDASTVYGSDRPRAEWLRTFEGGKLKTSAGDQLPWNTSTGEFNDATDGNSPFMEIGITPAPKRFYVAGDVRANENPLLIAIHTIFVREHNRICEEYRIEDPSLSDEELYQKARRWVSGLIQSIVYNEWLPTIGVHLSQYRGYRNNVNPQISNEFSAAAFRMGHTLINSNILRLESGGDEVAAGSISLRDAFFNPTAISLVGGIDPYLRGMGTQVQQKLDCKIVDDVRNFLFGAPDAGGMDLAAININRGRDRGLSDYNTLRAQLGLPSLDAMEEMTDDAVAIEDLKRTYGSVDNIDAWVGMLSESYEPGAMFGSTIMRIMEDQFGRLRDGDRFFYENDNAFTSAEIAVIGSTTLRDVIMRNTDIRIMQDNVFRATATEEIPAGPQLDNTPLAAIAYPNPTAGVTSIRVNVEADLDLQVEVYDNTGRLINSFVRPVSAGENDIPLDLSSYLNSSTFNVILRKNSLEFSVVRVTRI